MSRSEKPNLEDDLGTPRNSAVFVLLCIVIVFAVITYGAVDALATGIISLVVFIAAAVYVFQSIRAGTFRLPLNLLILPLLALVFIGFIQLLPFGGNPPGTDILGDAASRALSMDPFATQMFVARLVVLIIFFILMMALLSNEKRLLRCATFLLSFGTLMAFFGIVQKIADPSAIYGLRETPQAIPFGPYVNQHHFASLMVMLCGIALGLIFSKIRRDVLPLLAIAAVMMAVAVLFTGSRGGFISFAAMVGTIVILSASVREDAKDDDQTDRRTFRRWLPTLAGVAVLAMVIVATAVLLGAGDGLLRGVGLSGATDDVSSGRLHFWAIALQIFSANPFLGIGFDAFGIAFSQFDTRNGMFRVEQAHNEYLQILAEAGILGFLSVLAFIGMFLRQSVSIIRQAKAGVETGIRIGALAGCIAVMVHSLFDFPLRTHANSFVFLTLAAMAVQSIITKGRSRGRSSRQTSER